MFKLWSSALSAKTCSTCKKQGVNFTNPFAHSTNRPAVNFINILRAPFSYEVFSVAFFYFHFSFVIFWRQNFVQKKRVQNVDEIDVSAHFLAYSVSPTKTVPNFTITIRSYAQLFHFIHYVQRTCKINLLVQKLLIK